MKAYNHIILVVLTIVLFAVPISGHATTLEDGLNAYNQANYTEALRIFKSLADQGYADAQFNLGVMYEYGPGVTQNYTEAVKWYRKAADQGYAAAQFNLGVMYDRPRYRSKLY